MGNRYRGMLAVSAVLVLAIVAGVASAAGPNTWQPGPSMHIARVLPAVATLSDGRVMVAGSDTTGKAVELFSERTGAWTTVAPLNVVRDGGLAVTLKSGRVLVVGPNTSGEVYDPAANTWTSTANAMSVQRGQGGEITDPYQITLLPSGKVLLASSGGTPSTAVDLYDPADNSFHAAAPLGTAREFAGQALLPGGKVLVAGGFDAGTFLNTGEVYDPAHDTWTPVANSMAVGHAAPIMDELPGGKVLIAGGLTASGPSAAPTTDAEIYDPATNRFTQTGPMLQAGFLTAAGSMSGGRLLVAGGTTTFPPAPPFTPTPFAEVFQPATGTWTRVPDMPTAVLGPGAATLPSGRVLVVSGLHSGTSGTTATQIYTPATVPTAPRSVHATAGNNSATVSWKAPVFNGGAAVLSYTVTASFHGIKVTTPATLGRATVTGLPTGRPVTFTVTATNAAGNSPPSAHSAAVIPAGPIHLVIAGTKSKMTRKAFLAGVSATVAANQPVGLIVQVFGVATHATLARAYNLILASKSYGLGVRRKVKLKPNAALVGKSKHFSIQLRVTATTPTGIQRVVTKSIRVG